MCSNTPASSSVSVTLLGRSDIGNAMPDLAEEGVGDLLRYAAELAIAHRAAAAAVRPKATAAELRGLFGVDLPDRGRNGMEVVGQLAAAAGPGLVGNTGPDFFGWVMGASHPVGVAADWLTSTWGQNAAIYATSPAAAIAEEAVAKWLVDLLRLPEESSVGFVTGATMASFTCLAAARGEVLRRHGHDFDSEGLAGAPPITVFVGEEAHATIRSGLRYLGFGRKNLVEIASDAVGRMRADDLWLKLGQHEGPKIIVGQAGHLNSGAFDPFPDLVEAAERHSAWLHVDGAFGLWARAVPEFAELCDTLEMADSWSVDGHKWLQLPYDSGFAIVKDAHAHKRSMDITASYLAEMPEDGRNPTHYGPELSRRARGFGAWAVLQALGRNGVAELVRRHCRLARQLRSILADEPKITVMNEVFLNQLAIRFEPPTPRVDPEVFTSRVVAEIQKDDTCFVEQAVWKGSRILRVSIISADTQLEHVEHLANAIIRARRVVSAEFAA